MQNRHWLQKHFLAQYDDDDNDCCTGTIAILHVETTRHSHEFQVNNVAVWKFSAFGYQRFMKLFVGMNVTSSEVHQVSQHLPLIWGSKLAALDPRNLYFQKTAIVIGSVLHSLSARIVIHIYVKLLFLV
jgi:hypothetical protein